MEPVLKGRFLYTYVNKCDKRNSSLARKGKR